MVDLRTFLPEEEIDLGGPNLVSITASAPRAAVIADRLHELLLCTQGRIQWTLNTPHVCILALEQDYEVRYWTEELGITGDELRQAVAAVGNQAKAVRQHLNK